MLLQNKMIAQFVVSTAGGNFWTYTLTKRFLSLKMDLKWHGIYFAKALIYVTTSFGPELYIDPKTAP